MGISNTLQLTIVEAFFQLWGLPFAAALLAYIPLAVQMTCYEMQTDWFKRWKERTPGIIVEYDTLWYLLYMFVWSIVATLGYWLLRMSTDGYTDVLASSLCFYIGMLVLVLWNWLAFFEINILATPLSILASAAFIVTSVFFFLQGPWYAGFVSVFTAIGVVVLMLNYFAGFTLLLQKQLRRIKGPVRQVQGIPLGVTPKGRGPSRIDHPPPDARDSQSLRRESSVSLSESSNKSTTKLHASASISV